MIASLFLLLFAKRCAHWLHCLSFLLSTILVVRFQRTYIRCCQIKDWKSRDKHFHKCYTLGCNLGLVVGAIGHLIHSVSHCLSDLELMEIVGKTIWVMCLGQGSDCDSWAKSGPLLVFVNIYQNSVIPICLCCLELISLCTEELCSYDRDQMAHTPYNIYYLALYRRSLPI